MASTQKEKPKATSRKRAVKPAITDTLHVAIVLDMSGSMYSVWDETVAGLNQYVSDLREQEGETLFSLTIFDTVFEEWYVAEPVESIPYIGKDRYSPRGNTALYDAIAHTVASTEGRLKKQRRADERVLFVIITDGQENSSNEYSIFNQGRERIFELIKRYEAKDTWTFSYIGAGSDAYSADQHRVVAASIGVSAGNTATSTGATGARGAYGALGASSNYLRTNSAGGQSVGNTSALFADAGVDTDLDNFVLPEDSAYKSTAGSDTKKARQ